MDSILQSIKRQLGVPAEYDIFDETLILNINTVFMILYEMGVGPSTPFSITSDSETWNDFCEDPAVKQSVSSYIFMKVKLMFDPPASSFVTQNYTALIAELEWRLYSLSECNFPKAEGG